MARSTANFWDNKSPYEGWIESLGVPIHRGYFIEDCRKLELGYWQERACDAAFLQLAGQEGVTGAYVTEIPPGKTLPSFRMAIDEVVYVLQGRGLASVWAGERGKNCSSGKVIACF
jgi:quercetin dioxygenase-like cupin family protein